MAPPRRGPYRQRRRRAGWSQQVVRGALLGLAAVGTVVAALSRRADRRRRHATGPADPAQRAEPQLDVERVRAQRAQGGPVAATREVRRQAPWLSLGEAADLADRIG